jgi:phage-related protein
MDDEKQIRWAGTAYDDLLAFPGGARKDAGFQLGKVQAGPGPTDVSGIQKKAQTTSKQDKAIAAVRYRAVVNATKEKK